MTLPASNAKDFAPDSQRNFFAPGRQLGGLET